MVKALTYDNPDHKIKLKIGQFQVMGKSTKQINKTGYENETIGYVIWNDKMLFHK